MKNLTKRFMNDESGATAIEYGLIAAGISIAIVGGVTLIGGSLSTTFTTISDAVAVTPAATTGS